MGIGSSEESHVVMDDRFGADGYLGLSSGKGHGVHERWFECAVVCSLQECKCHNDILSLKMVIMTKNTLEEKLSVSILLTWNRLFCYLLTMTIASSSHQVEVLRAQYISEVEVLVDMLRRAADVVERHGNEIRANLGDMQRTIWLLLRTS